MKLTNISQLAKAMYLILGIMLSAGIATAEKIDGTKNKRIITYYGEWVIWGGQDNFNPDQMPLDRLTHVNYAFIDCNSKREGLIHVSFDNKIESKTAYPVAKPPSVTCACFVLNNVPITLSITGLSLPLLKYVEYIPISHIALI